jgi:hypothetical protein
VNEIQQLVLALQQTVIRQASVHDAEAAYSWMDEVVEEAFADIPRTLILAILLDEVRKKMTLSREVADRIDEIKQVLARPARTLPTRVSIVESG